MRLDDLVLNEVRLEEAFLKMRTATDSCNEGLCLDKKFILGSFPIVRVDKAGNINVKVTNPDRDKEMNLKLEGKEIHVNKLVGYTKEEAKNVQGTLTTWLTAAKVKAVQEGECNRKKHYTEIVKLTLYAVEGLVIPGAKVYKDNERDVGLGHSASLVYRVTYSDKLRSASVRVAFNGMVVPEYSRGLTDQAGEDLIKIFENWLEVERKATGFSLFKWGMA